VVGVIANLALYFAVHTLFAATNPWRWGRSGSRYPTWPACDRFRWPSPPPALVMIFRLRWSVPRTLLVCAGLGLAAALAGMPVS
jgi:chromate transporter